jgi:hypothetical protein
MISAGGPEAVNYVLCESNLARCRILNADESLGISLIKYAFKLMERKGENQPVLTTKWLSFGAKVIQLV